MLKNNHESTTQRSPAPSEIMSCDEISLKNTRQNKRRSPTRADYEDIRRTKQPRNGSGLIDTPCGSRSEANNEGQNTSSGNSEVENEDNEEIRPPEMLHFDRDAKYAASGLKDTLHGDIYQLKLLSVFLHRGLKIKFHDFRLATEMKWAGKFDDVVFQYKETEESEIACLYLQAKHRQDESKTISASDLLNEENGDFSLQKYFISYRKIKKHPKLSKFKLKHCIIWTNIDFDCRNKLLEASKINLTNVHDEELKPSKIGPKEVEKCDVLLDIGHSTKKTVQYKLVIDKKSQVHEILGNTSDADVLAKTLAKHVVGNKPITLHPAIFKLYHIALATEVFSEDKKEWSDSFISGTTENGKKFLKIYLKKHLKLDPLSKALDQKKLPNISKDFGKKFKPRESTLKNSSDFSKAFVRLIRNAKNDNSVKIDREIYKESAEEGTDERVIGIDIDKLAGHVLIVEDQKIQFKAKFLNGVGLEKLGNIKEFQESLKTELKDEYDNLYKYQFEVENSTHWNTLYSRNELPDDPIDGTEISEFFEDLIFAVNQLNEDELGNAITDEIAASNQWHRSEANFASDYLLREMLDWFKKKDKVKDKEGTYLTAEKGRALFQSIKQELDTVCLSKLSSWHLEELQGYGRMFENENQALENFLNRDSKGNKGKRSFNLIAAEDTWPTTIRAHQAIRKMERYKGNDSLIYMRLCENAASKVENLVIRAFESWDNPDLFVIECRSTNKQYVRELCRKLCNSMNKNSTKKLILVTKFAGIRLNVHFEACEEKRGESGFNNLTENSRQYLLEKSVINFQGETGISFEELLSNNSTDFGKSIDSSTFSKLIRGKEVIVGDDLHKLDFYIKRTFNQVFFKNSIFECQLKSEVYVISGKDIRILERLVTNQETIRSCDRNFRQTIYSNKFIITDNNLVMRQFQKLCHEYSSDDYNVHWLRSESGKLIWIQSRGDITNVMKYRDVIECQSSNYDADRPTVNSLTDDDLVHHDEERKVIIISITTVTLMKGETTILTHLARKIRETNSVTWVIRINLKHFTEQLRARSFEKDDFDGAVDFLVTSLSSLETNLDKDLLKIAMKNQRKVALLFDGFSGISADLHERVINLLQTFTKRDQLKLLITATSNMVKMLEENLGVFSHTMVPLSRKDQIDILIRSLGQSDNNFIERSEKSLRRCAEIMFEKLSTAQLINIRP